MYVCACTDKNIGSLRTFATGLPLSSLLEYLFLKLPRAGFFVLVTSLVQLFDGSQKVGDFVGHAWAALWEVGEGVAEGARVRAVAVAGRVGRERQSDSA